MFHGSALPQHLAREDTSVPLLRTRIPLIVLQDWLCSVYAAGAFPGQRWRLCVVNVKLTMGFPCPAGLLWSADSMSRQVFSRFPARSLHRWRQTDLVVARGGVGISPRGLARKVSETREGFPEPSLFL